MSNRPNTRRQHVNARKRRNAAVLVASRLAGCSCNPDIRHGSDDLQVLHDDWCQLGNDERQVLIIGPSWRPPHREDPTR